MTSGRGIGATLLAALALALVPTAAAAAPKVDGEFTVASLDANNKIAEGPDGNMWVTLADATNEVAKIDPKTGAVTEFDLGPLNGVSGIAAGPDKNLWVVSAGRVTRFAPANPNAFSTTSIPQISGNYSIVAGPDGNLWVATNEALLRIPPASPENAIAFEIIGLSPRDIDAAAGNLIVADFAGNRLLVATPAKAANKEFTEVGSVASPIVNPQGVAGSPSGEIAFSAPGRNPEAFGIVKPPAVPQFTDAPGTDPFGVALGPDGAFWIAHAFGNGSAPPGSLSRLGLDGKVTTLTGLAAGAEPRQIAGGPGNTIWVTLPANVGDDKVARITGVEKAGGDGGATASPPHLIVPETSLTKRPKGPLVKAKARRVRVVFAFSSPNPGVSFECRLVPLAKHAKQPAFVACGSPKSYRLAPGRYRFEVRAVLKGVADASPAKASFQVLRIARHPHRAHHR